MQKRHASPVVGYDRRRGNRIEDQAQLKSGKSDKPVALIRDGLPINGFEAAPAFAARISWQVESRGDAWRVVTHGLRVHGNPCCAILSKSRKHMGDRQDYG